MKNDHLAALMKQQADKTKAQAALAKQQAALVKEQAALTKKQAALAKDLEKINASIKRMVMEESTSPLISVKIEEEEVIDLTSPNVKVEDIATSDDTTIKLEDVEIENVSTHTTMSNIATAPTVNRTNTTTPIVTRVTIGKGNKKSQKISPIQSMRQALKTIPGNRLLSPIRRKSSHTPPKVNSTLRDLDPIWPAAENNTTGEELYKVKAKLFKSIIGGQSKEWVSDNCIHHLRLYRRNDNGRTQLVVSAIGSGNIKLNVMISSMYDLEFTIVRNKIIEVGQLSFISMVSTGVPGRFGLRVNRNAVYDLYWELVRLGALEKM